MKKVLKKVLSVVLSVAMIVTSVTVYNKTAKAAEISEMIEDSGYNLALNKNVQTGYAGFHGTEGNLTLLTDGKTTTGRVYPLEQQNGWYQVDLGDYYTIDSIDQVVSFYNETANTTWPCKGYQILYSMDGTNFKTVKTVAATEAIAEDLTDAQDMTDIEPVDLKAVRYVRLFYPDQYLYGVQLREFAVLNNEGTAQTVAPETPVTQPQNVTAISEEDYKITVRFDVIEGYTYQVYINDELKDENAVPGTTYTVEKGTYTVKVIAVDSEGWKSEPVIIDEIYVDGAATLSEMAADSEVNLALNKTYIFDPKGNNTNGSYEGNGSIVDGNTTKEGSYSTSIQNQENSGVIIDLGKTYNSDCIDQVAVWFRDSRDGLSPINGGYEVQYSYTGDSIETATNFETVASISSEELKAFPSVSEDTVWETVLSMNNEELTDTIAAVRYVRINFPKSMAWGAQIREVALLDTDKNAHEVELGKTYAPKSITAQAEKYNKVSGVITAPDEADETYTYTVTLTNSENSNTITEHLTSAGEFVIHNVPEGTYTVKAAAVSNGFMSAEVEAAEPVTVLSGWTYTQTTKNDIFDDTNEDGYFNYIRYENISAVASSEILAASNAIDNNMGTRWESEQHVDPQFIIIDLGAVYSVKEISMIWEGANAKNFTIDCSTDAKTFESVAIIQNAASVGNRYDQIVLTDLTQVRFIRINGTERNQNYGYSIWEMAVYGPDEQKEYDPSVGVLTEPKRLRVESYGKYTGKYFVTFQPCRVADEYKVYVDDQPIKTIKKSGQYLTSEDLTQFEKGTHTLSVTSIQYDDTGEEIETETKAAVTEFTIEEAGNANDITQVYISTNGRGITRDYFKTGDVNIAIIDPSGAYKDIIDCESDIKIRGNTTAGGQKAPYNFKLGSKENVLGMDGKAKKWSLLANSFDKSLIRNALVMDMAQEVGLIPTSEYRFVDVYRNGEYLGNYMLIESVEEGKGRVDIDSENWENTDMLLELDNRGDEAEHLDRTSMNVWFAINEPEPDDPTIPEFVEKKARVLEILNNFETALQADDYEAMSQCIDMDSFVKFYIVNEFFRTQDFNYSSTRFYVKDGIIYAGPCWDYDLSSGNIGNYYNSEYHDGKSYNSFKAQEMTWYRYLMQNETFKRKVISAYTQYQPLIEKMIHSGIDEMTQKIRGSINRNYLPVEELGAGWRTDVADAADGFSYAGNGEWKTYDDTITFLKTWLTNRNDWLKEQWEIGTGQTVISKDIAITGYQITTALGGENDKVGIRTVYQAEPLVEGQNVTELGLVIGLDNGQITDDDMILNSVNEFVVDNAATEDGKLVAKMGDSLTADYYVMTMDIAGGFTQNYKVRTYAILEDGTVAYSEIKTFNILDVAKELYESGKMPNYEAHESLYKDIISQAEPEYAALEYNWNQTLVNKPEAGKTSDIAIEGYQMSGSLNGVAGTLGLRVVYSVDNTYKEADEVGLIYGLMYQNSITEADMTVDSESMYVVHYAATEEGKLDAQMGTSGTAQYYARTMNVTGLNKTGYTVSYMVRAYAKTADGVWYSDVQTYNINDVASLLYDNDLMSTFTGHEALYDNILKKVNPDYAWVDYTWSKTMVQ